MNTKIKSFLVVCFVILVAFIIIKATKNSATKNLTDAKAIYSLPSNQLIAAYLDNQQEFEKKYVGKIIEVEGLVEDINTLNGTITIILRSQLENYGVICDMNQLLFKSKNKKIKVGTKIIVKGICKGILKDVILLNCVII